ncbi:MAG TPA: DUF4403 family protein [bacterium]|jgi:hypothetical protein|nr:DUF4403 family protein [bacterium]
MTRHPFILPKISAVFRRDEIIFVLFLVLSSFWAGGCSTLPHRMTILPAPVTSFPPAKPALVRLPIDITFPSGGAVQKMSNYLKGGMTRIMPDLLKIPGLRLRSRMADLWGKMDVPIQLDKGLWLLIRPETLSVGRMRTDLKRASTAHVVLEMIADPEIVFGPKPLTTPVAMPPLQRFQPGPGIFQAVSNARITYKEANQYLSDPRMKLIGMVLPGSGERKLTIVGIRLYGSGGKVIVEVKLHYNPPIINFEGKPANLTVYLSGTPRFLAKERLIDLPDLDYDIKSSDLMVQVADWLFKSDFRNEMRQAARIPIGAKMDLLKEKIIKALNRPLSPSTRISTQVNSFKVLDGFVDNEGIQARLSIMGTATMEVIWK